MSCTWSPLHTVATSTSSSSSPSCWGRSHAPPAYSQRSESSISAIARTDFRVPDGGLHREPRWTRSGIRPPRCVLEIVSPGDESWEKLPFYAAHHVDKVLIVDPQERSVSWLGLQDGEYRPIERSGLIELGKQELAERAGLAARRLTATTGLRRRVARRLQNTPPFWRTLSKTPSYFGGVSPKHHSFLDDFGQKAVVSWIGRPATAAPTPPS